MNKTKSLYMHLGFHKTGSTSFQATCYANRRLLCENGIQYLIFSDPEKDSTICNHSIPISSLFREDSSRYLKRLGRKIDNYQALKQLYMTELVNQLSRPSDIIMSGENISMLSHKSLERLCSVIHEHEYRIIPFAIVRSPFEFFTSATQEKIKAGRHIPYITFGHEASILLPAKPNIDLRVESIKRLNSFFGNTIEYTPFRKACTHPKGVIGYILEKNIHLDPLLIDKITEKRLNDSKSNVWIRAQNQANKIQPRIKQQRLNPKHFSIGKIPYASKQKFMLTEAEFDAIKDDYKAAEDVFSALMPDEFMDDDMNFSAPIAGLDISSILSDFNPNQRAYSAD
jgi:hypothetical protein